MQRRNFKGTAYLFYQNFKARLSCFVRQRCFAKGSARTTKYIFRHFKKVTYLLWPYVVIQSCSLFGHIVTQAGHLKYRTDWINAGQSIDTQICLWYQSLYSLVNSVDNQHCNLITISRISGKACCWNLKTNLSSLQNYSFG